ncbi:MAG: COG1361 S-layer family protein [Bacillota bacterium]|jgi:hypothetical protein
MKRITSLVLCLLLLFAGVAPVGVPLVRAADDPPATPVIRVNSYSVKGVLGVSNVYAVTLELEWDPYNAVHAEDGKDSDLEPIDGVLHSLSIEANAGSFVHAIKNGSTYAVSSNPIPAQSSTINALNSGSRTASGTFYFIRTGAGDDLTIGFSFEYGEVDDGTETRPSGTSSKGLTVIKTAPDPQEPEWPDPEPPVDTSKYRPIIGVDSEKEMPLLTAESDTLVIPIKNTSSYSASRVNVQLEPAGSQPLFTANSMAVGTSVGSLGPNGTKDAEFNVSLAPGATTGIHAVVLNFSYRNSYGDDFTSSATAYIQVQAQNLAPRLAAVCSTPLLILDAATKGAFAITNSGDSDAHNVKVTLQGLSAAGISLRQDTDVRYLDSIASQESAEVEFNLFAASSLTESSAMLQIKLEYTDISGQAYSETNTVFIPLHNVDSSGDDGEGVPRLIIDRYDFGGREVRAGSQFALQLDLKNTSRNQTIRNLKVTVQSNDGTFLPVDASNTLFIEEIKPQEVYPTALPMTTKPDAENKPYSLNITFEYEAKNGQAYNSQEVISISVLQPPRLVVGDPVFYGQPMMYQMMPVNLEFYNLGKTMLHNLMIKAEGPFQIEGGNYFVGNFSPGMSDSFNFALTPTEPGSISGAVVFSFEDSVGTPIEVRRTFDLNVMEPFVPDEGHMGPPMPEPKKTNVLLYVGIGVAALLAVIGGVVFYLRRRKKRRFELQRAEDMMAAAQMVIPEIEYVGFDQGSEQEQGQKPQSKEE